MEERISVGVAEVVDVVMPGQTNQYGTLFGGVVMAMMDKAANIAATRYCKHDCVTVSVDHIVFEKPIHLGEIAIVAARLIHVGRSSMLVRVKVEAESKDGQRRVVIACADFAFVAVDSTTKTVEVPRPILETDEERYLFERGKVIKESMQRLC